MADASFPITIDPPRCTGCAACVPVCHERAMSIRAGKVEIDRVSCSTCSQCIALCPERALRWRGVEPTVRRPERMPSPAQLDELMKQRRSVRSFKREPVPRSELAAIANYAASSSKTTSQARRCRRAGTVSA